MMKQAYWVLRCERQLLTTMRHGAELVFPSGLATDFGTPKNILPVGQWQGLPCYAADVDAFPKIPTGEGRSLRAIFQLGGAEIFALAGRSTQLLDWQNQHRFCGQCGTPTQTKSGEHAMQCPSCGLLAYPRISPAVMVLVQNGDKLLLARSPHFKAGVFSALAGFVEPGETLEACASREVREEVGIEIANLRYFHSQPWPFPNSLMVAFFADYAGGTITPDRREIEAAEWFSPDALPLLPEPISISRQLIDAARQSLQNRPTPIPR
ncbi:MAG: NAD(+) diphosphatase [Betaproteobacteria bacterium HGW-Betaproteobacteria-10]|nr:MAG: NAD(+) diphosphatase [Betaproteobacteria bacterium HGW-Betaproteobacteria-10]